MADENWVEVSFKTNGELAEAVAEVLSRYVSQGVVVENGIYFRDADDPGTPTDEVRVYGYLVIDEQLEEKKQAINEAIWHLSQIQPLPDPTYRIIKDENWMESWKEHYHPIPVGKKLMVVPAWLETPDPERIAIKIDPSMAFGTGTHPTTQLCLEMIEKYVQPGQNVIDVGCGSGILSIAAIKLGVKHALGVDIDNASVISTRKNAETNQVLQGIETGMGSVEEIRQGNFSISQAPVVMVNILATIILILFEAGLSDLVEENGTLILSGILDEQLSRIEAAAQQHGLTKIDQLQSGDWVALTYHK